MGNEFIANKELLSAQPVLAPWIVNAAVVVPQSHRSVVLPLTDKDGMNLKQFSVLVCAVSIRVGKVTMVAFNATVGPEGPARPDSVNVVSVIQKNGSGTGSSRASGRTVPLLLSESLLSLHAAT